MMHTRRAEYCRLLRRGISNQESAVRGFRRLAELAPNRDIAALWHLLHHYAHRNVITLRQEHARRCNNG